MKRLISLLLALLLICTDFALPAAGIKRPGAWERIAEIEDSVCSKRGLGASDAARAFTAVLDEITDAIISAPEYLPDSLFRSGDAIYWQTSDGVSCGYSPTFRAKVRSDAKQTVPMSETEAAPTAFDATRGGNPGSVNVAVFQPYYGLDLDFTTQYQTEGASVAQELGGQCNLYQTTKATIDNIAYELQNSAVVFFDSHGITDYDNGKDSVSRANTSYLCLQSGEGITNEDMQPVNGTYGRYFHAFYAGQSGQMQYYCVDGAAIANHMQQQAPNNLLWSAICLGMATDGMAAPLRAKGVEVVYGYSDSVTFKADYLWEKIFWQKMKEGSTVADAASSMKQVGGDKDPYESTNPAYPIFADSEDPYPGRGNLTTRQAVCSSWTLFPQYRLRVTVNDSDYGSATAVGGQITVRPKDNCSFVGYELVSGSADVIVNGNVLFVRMHSDCTVRVNFAPKEKARLILTTPRQQEQYVYEKYIGDSVKLPEADNLTQGYDNSCFFCGWTTAPVEWSDGTPAVLYPAGSSYLLTGESESLCALYTVFDKSLITFTPVRSAPADWTGSYVIMQDGYVLDYDGTAIEQSAAGIQTEGEKLLQADDRYVFHVVQAPSGECLIARSSDSYFLSTEKNSNALCFSPSVTDDYGRWDLSCSIGFVLARNRAIPDRGIGCVKSMGRFYCYASWDLLEFYRAEGDRHYTTAPKPLESCSEHDFSAWVEIVPPSCTQNGAEGRTCSVCGAYEQRPVLSPGHTLVLTPSQHPTCTQAGQTDMITCSVCGLVLQKADTLPALGHSWSKPAVLQEPEDWEPGLCEYVCTACGTRKTQLLSCGLSLQCKNDDSCFGRVFTDMPPYGNWAHQPIDWAAANDITNGVSLTRFLPGGSCTRGQIVTFLWRTAGCPDVTGLQNPFNDVNQSLYCYESVLWAVSQGITNGVKQDEFRPNDVCTRAQVVTFLWRFAGCIPPSRIHTEFQDVSQSGYYATAVSWAVEQSITNGMSPTQFRPSSPCTRAQVVAFLYRALCNE